MDKTTIYIIALRLKEIRERLLVGKKLSDKEKTVFLLGTGKKVPSDPSEAVIMIDKIFLDLKKALGAE